MFYYKKETKLVHSIYLVPNSNDNTKNKKREIEQTTTTSSSSCMTKFSNFYFGFQFIDCVRSQLSFCFVLAFLISGGLSISEMFIPFNKSFPTKCPIFPRFLLI